MKLPLFPLDTVLFPGCTLDLQIFEARYLDMVSRCLKAGHGFGVVRIIEGSEVGPAAAAFADIGCEAVVRDWQQQPNGLLGIRVEGARCFEVQSCEVLHDQLIEASVNWCAEAPEQPLDETHDDLLILLEALARHPMVEVLGMSATVDGQRALANQLAYLLPFSAAEKIALLRLADPAEQLQVIQALLEQMQNEAGS